MAIVDKMYHQILKGILDNGYLYKDESRDVMCKQVSSLQLSLPVLGELPFVTTKKLHYKSLITELVWFLQGRTNIKYLIDRNVNIWNKDAYNWYVKMFKLAHPNFQQNLFSLKEFVMRIEDAVDEEELVDFQGLGAAYTLGDVGRNYSAQWRDFRGISENYGLSEEDYPATFEPTTVDQIVHIIEQAKAKPMNRRNIVTAWNPDEVNQTALPPCHWAFELLPRPLYNFEKEEFGKEWGLDLKWHQRSVDTFLGLPFNIGSYGILTHFIADLLNFLPLGVIGDLSNIHLYEGDIERAKTQLKKDTKTFKGAQLSYSERLQNNIKLYQEGQIMLEELLSVLEPEDFIISEYKSFEEIKGDMLAPKEI